MAAVLPARPPGWRLHHIALAGLVVAFLAWSADGVNLRPGEVAGALPVIGEYFARMWPPKWEFSEVLWKPAAETLYIALWGNVIALLIGLPLGLCAAGNVVRSALVRNGAKAVLNLLRSISELIWAVFFVAAVGLGPFPGALALGVNFGGILGRLYAEALENIDPGPVEALAATGASRLQVMAYAMLPQALPQFVTYNLYWFEVGVRSATVLGMVGAGGIGFELISSMKLFAYEDTAACVIVILVLVLAADLVSSKLRAMIR